MQWPRGEAIGALERCCAILNYPMIQNRWKGQMHKRTARSLLRWHQNTILRPFYLSSSEDSLGIFGETSSIRAQPLTEFEAKGANFGRTRASPPIRHKVDTRAPVLRKDT
jgi:phage gp36-like protein